MSTPINWSDVVTDKPPGDQAAPSPLGHTTWEDTTSSTLPSAPGVGSNPNPVGNEIGGFLDQIGVAGPAEALLHTASGAVAGPAAGLASTYQLLTSPSGLKAKNAAQAAQATQQALTYQPRTQSGQEKAGQLDEVLGMLGPTEGQWLQDKALQYGVNPYVAGSLNVAAQIPSVLLGAKIGEGRTVGRQAGAEAQAAMNAGYRLTPQQAGAGMISRDVSALASRVQLERDLSHKNADVTDNLARADVGIPRKTPINDATLDKAAAPWEDKYNQVENLPGIIQPSAAYRQEIAQVPNYSGSGGNFSFDTPATVVRRLDGYGNIPQFTAKEALGRIKALRAEANRIDRSPAYSPDGDAIASANRGIARALENELDRHVQGLTQPITLPNGSTIVPSNVSPTLLQEFREARVQLAKINNVRSALNGPNVDASVILRQRRRGEPLTGGLADIANMAENFDRSVQVPSKIRDHPLGIMDLGFGGGGFMLAHGPYGAAALLARPLVRQALMTKLYQKYMRNPFPAATVTGPASMAPTMANQNQPQEEPQ